MKNIVISCVMAATFGAFAETVQNVTCTPLADGRLEISYELGSAPAIVTLSAKVGNESVSGINLRQVSGDVNKEIATTGTKKIYWRPADDTARVDGSSTKTPTANALLANATVTVTAWSVDDPPDVMVVDLADPLYGDARVKYYENVESLPGGLLDSAAYRFQKLVMKRIHANGVSWISGCSYCGTTTTTDAKYDPNTCYCGGQEYPTSRKLDHDYYLGVFELTKGQHSMIMGALKVGKYNLVGERFFRPADSLSFIDVRGGADSFYPAAPAADSILGKLRTRTNLKFDLPGEYEWEFAAASGHGPTVQTYNYQEVGSVPEYWGNGQMIDASMGKCRDDGLPGRYACNSGYYDPNTYTEASSWSDETVYGPTNATAYCGSSAPNDFGLYDMHGNVSEWCLDYYTKTTNSGLNPPINADGLLPRIGGDVDGKDVTTNRMVRGGSYLSTLIGCRSCYRNDRYSSFAAARPEIGCRIACPVADRFVKD